MKPKLLIVELWGVGDLAIATPFIRAATEKFHVTILAKTYARDLQERFWPDVTVVPFHSPWTAFRQKYHLGKWPWKEFIKLRHPDNTFDIGVSARWDPRDHLLLAWIGAKRRIGFPRLGSRLFLTRGLQRPGAVAHRYAYWKMLADELDIPLPAQSHIDFPRFAAPEYIVVHTGAAQPVRVWPLDRYAALVRFLRTRNFPVKIICDSNQKEWWESAGEKNVVVPASISELIEVTRRASVFIGNDSGPGHLAASLGIPTFTLFGPQFVKSFIPLHPASEAVEGKPCPYKPCSDYCRFAKPVCLHDISVAEVESGLDKFLAKNIRELPKV